MYTLDEVYTKEKIIPALEKVNLEVFRQFKSLSLDEFYYRPKGKWSAWDTLRHLNKTVDKICLAMRLPKFVLGMMFGKNERRSKQFLEIKEVYLLQLKNGAGAGKYAPAHKSVPKTQSEAEAERRRVIKRWKKISKTLVKVVHNWTDSPLDKYQLPHPILGNITVREMLLFNLYHNLHHTNTVQQRVQEMHAGS